MSSITSITKEKYRVEGENALASVLTIPKNVAIIESVIFKQVSKEVDCDDDDDDVKKRFLYKQYVFQTVGHILDGCKLKLIIEKINQSNFIWGHECFLKICTKIEEQDNFITNPIEVSKGVAVCKKCGSDRVFSYSKQTRSSDEGITTFCQCVVCKSKWTNS
jgi:DNA-directed RNA polymerase subunit M/transcription elongation factor TFIIS